MADTTPPTSFPSRRQQRFERRLARRGSSGLGGLLLIGLAVLLLLQQYGSFHFGRWWALLILVPAGVALANAWKEFTAAGQQLNQRTLSSLIGGLVLILVAAAVLLDLDWGWFGPMILLLLGLGLLGRSSSPPPSA